MMIGCFDSENPASTGGVCIWRRERRSIVRQYGFLRYPPMPPSTYLRTEYCREVLYLHHSRLSVKNSQAKPPHRAGLRANTAALVFPPTHFPTSSRPPILLAPHLYLHDRRDLLAVRPVQLGYWLYYYCMLDVQAHGPSSLRHRYSRFGSCRDLGT